MGKAINFTEEIKYVRQSSGGPESAQIGTVEDEWKGMCREQYQLRQKVEGNRGDQIRASHKVIKKNRKF